MLESSIDTTDMISARDAQECEPRGRSVCASHPGSTAPTFTGATEPEHGLPLVKALKDISIKDSIKVCQFLLYVFTIYVLNFKL